MIKAGRIWCMLFAAGLFLCFAGCNPNNAAAAADKESVPAKNVKGTIASAASLLQDGDLVTRSDNDFESLTLQNFSDSDRTYSHSGLAFKEGESFVVYHAMTGTENPSGLVRKDPFDSFVSPGQKTGFGIFRYQLSKEEIEKLHLIMSENLHNKIPFDNTFNLATDDSLYCSEMIGKGLKKATGGRIILPVTVMHNFTPKLFGHTFKQKFFKRFEYIAIDNLYLNPYCKEITRVVY